MNPLALSALLAAGTAAGTPPVEAAPRLEITQLTIRQRVIMRVPTRTQAPAREMRWVEKKGPRCIGSGTIAAAAISGRERIDLILRGGTRLRVEFANSCPALDYYSGFYILPSADNQICADRDAIRARSGGACEIERFRTLVAEPAPPPKRRGPLDRLIGR